MKFPSLLLTASILSGIVIADDPVSNNKVRQPSFAARARPQRKAQENVAKSPDMTRGSNEGGYGQNGQKRYASDRVWGQPKAEAAGKQQNKPLFDEGMMASLRKASQEISEKYRQRNGQKASGNTQDQSNPDFKESIRKASQQVSEMLKDGKFNMDDLLGKPQKKEGQAADDNNKQDFKEYLRTASQKAANFLKDGDFNIDNILGGLRKNEGEEPTGDKQNLHKSLREASQMAVDLLKNMGKKNEGGDQNLDTENLSKTIREMTEKLGLGDVMKNMKGEDIESAQKKLQSLFGQQKRDNNAPAVDGDKKKPSMNFFEDLFGNLDLGKADGSDDSWGFFGNKNKPYNPYNTDAQKKVDDKKKGKFQKILDSDDDWTSQSDFDL